MPRKKSNYISKQVSFIRDSAEEMELYKWLQTLAHGQFSEEVKEYFLNKMVKDKLKREERNANEQ